MALSHGHYNAAVFDPTLNEYDCMIRTIPLEFECSPSQWLFVTDIEILKKAGVLEIDGMRLIQLRHPEFQINNKLVGKESLQITNSVMDLVSIIKWVCWYSTKSFLETSSTSLEEQIAMV